MPMVIFSVPLAFLAGQYNITEKAFFILLGVSLIIASGLMLKSMNIESRKLPRFFNAFAGGGIGALSGLVGIGGGIFLSPILHLTKWEAPKVIAATTAFFILVNSLAGLAGQILTHGFKVQMNLLLPLVLVVLVGGQFGARMSIRRFSPFAVRKITGILVLIVGLRILWKYLII